METGINLMQKGFDIINEAFKKESEVSEAESRLEQEGEVQYDPNFGHNE